MGLHLDRVSIIGAGTLGGTIAYSLLMGEYAKEILLVDRSNKIVQGQALDLTEACEGTDITVRAGTFKEAGQSSMVIFTADSPMNPSEGREEWLVRNRNLLISIASAMSPVQPNIMILVASQPVDLFVQSFQNYFPHISPNKIFGIGTTMASIRLRSALVQIANSKDSIVEDAYCIGSLTNPIILWNHAKVNGVAISNIPLLAAQRKSLETVASIHRHKLICERKGNAWYGLAAVITKLIVDILSCKKNKKGKGKAVDGASAEATFNTWVLSTYVPQYDAYLSWPVEMNSEGIEKIVDIPLTSNESAQVMKVVQSNILDYQSSLE